jgi:hypothetical protein
MLVNGLLERPEVQSVEGAVEKASWTSGRSNSPFTSISTMSPAKLSWQVLSLSIDSSYKSQLIHVREAYGL